jgi:hypothetical protein
MRAAAGVALAAAVVLGAVAPSAQQPVALDHRLTPDTLGNPSMDVITSVPFINDFAAWRIAALARMPIGIEIEDVPAERRVRIDLEGFTARLALDALIAAEPRYVWIDRGIPTILPRTALTDPNGELNRTVGVHWSDVTAEQALSNAMRLITKGRIGSRPPAAPYDGRRFDVIVPSGTIRDVLCETARAHGGIIWYAVRSREGVITALTFRWFDGHTVGFGEQRYPPSRH